MSETKRSKRHRRKRNHISKKKHGRKQPGKCRMGQKSRSRKKGKIPCQKHILMVSVFQIYYDKETGKNLDPFFFPYDNSEAKDDFFENTVIRKVYEEKMNSEEFKNSKYFGVTSWKQFDKSHLSGHEIVPRIHEDDRNGHGKDVYIYYVMDGIKRTDDEQPTYIIQKPDIWHWHFHRYEQLHKDNELLNNSEVLPFDIFDGKWQYCICNYFIAKRHVFEDYCKNILIPALDFYSQPAVEKIMPKWYRHSSGRMVNSSCFTLEGLFGSFLAHRNYSIQYLCKKKMGIRKMSMLNVKGYTKE